MRMENRQTADAAAVVRPRSVNRTVACEAHETASEQEPPAKRIKVEEGTASTGAEGTSQTQTTNISNSKTSQDSRAYPIAETSGIGQSSVVTNSPVVSNFSGSSSVESLHPPATATATDSVVHPPAPAPPTTNPSVESPAALVPLKSTLMAHLQTKYQVELEYMLLEFRKLERQLLGAKGAAQIEESAGSRERREKLHSFILHLEDTIRQIDEGCRLEAGAFDASASLSLKKGGSTDGETTIPESKRKETEESVQKLEEHILANLLPVKVRLKKQLAAQQGATRNPAGMPAPRRGSYVASSSAGAKGTFAAAAEQRQKQAEAARLAAQEQQEQKMREVSDPTQFGTPLKGGSSLTRNLHGATLGSKRRTHGHGVGACTQANEEPTNGRILYGGMVPESTQHRSGVAAASGVHEMVIESPSLLTPTESVETAEAPEVANHPIVPLQSSTPVAVEISTEKNTLSHKPPPPTVAAAPPPGLKQPKPVPVQTVKVQEPEIENIEESLTDEERRRMRKKRRKRKLLRIARRRERERQRLVVTQPAHPANIQMKVVGGGRKKSNSGKNNGRKKGPRAVEYICALCNDPYNSTCEYNPWWALSQQECPKCRKVQIPRIDITAPANQIEYHPALLAHIDDNGGNVGSSASAVSQYLPKPPPPLPPHARLVKPIQHLYREPLSPGSDSDSDLSELSDGSLSDLSVGSSDSDFDFSSLTPVEQAEHETFGHKYKGPALSEDHASRLLVLMQHSSTCPCRHKSKRHRDVCRSVKYLMLHVRDCPGSTSNFDVCPFPWCRKVKHLLYHLVSCSNATKCKICSPPNLSPSLHALKGLNQFRAKIYRERLITFMKRSAAARRAAATLAYNSKTVGPHPPYVTAAKGASALKPIPAIHAKHPPRSAPPSGIARKGKETGIPATVGAPPTTQTKATSATVFAHHPWTAMQKSAAKAPPKQIRAPMLQHLQSSKDTNSQAAGKTQSLTTIKGVDHKVSAPPTYASVEDPLRASAAQRVQNPVQVSTSPISGATLAASKPVGSPIPEESSQHGVSKPVSAISTARATPNAESNPATSVKNVRPVASLVSQQTPSKSLLSHPAALSPSNFANGVPDGIAPGVGQSATVSRKAPPVIASSPSLHAPAASHLQPQSVAQLSTRPVSTTVEVNETPMQAALMHQTALQSALSSALASAKPAMQKDNPPTATQQPHVLTSLPPSGHPTAHPESMQSVQTQNVPQSHPKVEIATAPAASPTMKVPSHANAAHLAHLSQPAAAGLASVSSNDVTKVLGSEPVEHQASVRSVRHFGAPAPPLQMAKQATTGTVQTQTKPAPHSKPVPANSIPAVAASVKRTEQLVAASPPSRVPITPVTAQAALVPLSNANSTKHPSASAPSSHVTREPAIETVPTLLASTRPTATPRPPTVGGTLHIGASSQTMNVTKSPVAGAIQAQSRPPSPARGQSVSVSSVIHQTNARSALPPSPSGDRTNLRVAEKIQVQHISTDPQTSIPATEVTVLPAQSNGSKAQHTVAATLAPEVSSQATTTPVIPKATHGSSGRFGTAIPNSSSASQFVQTKLEPGRPMSTNAAEHATVKTRKVEQTADIVKVGG
ncbi:unnamed protein product [Cylindrotheca closterium]|uniref:TAZ-type domain-containing protein n=1 Tax=Cylindrotheca closterium TaxID=2856 RepID=A0AAD2G8Y5_9STRA|nr:unnamed protein product [Cylindrotheca closterium]